MEMGSTLRLFWKFDVIGFVRWHLPCCMPLLSDLIWNCWLVYFRFPDERIPIPLSNQKWHQTATVPHSRQYLMQPLSHSFIPAFHISVLILQTPAAFLPFSYITSPLTFEREGGVYIPIRKITSKVCCNLTSLKCSSVRVTSTTKGCSWLKMAITTTLAWPVLVDITPTTNPSLAKSHWFRET